MASQNDMPLPERRGRRNSGQKPNYWAQAALILGILGGGVVAIAVGWVGLERARESGGSLGGEGMAKAGIAIATIELLVFVGLFAAGVIG